MKAASDRFDPYLRLEDPGGREVAHDDDSGGFPNARITFRAPQAGDYRVVCTTYAPRQAGSYVLTVRQQ
jgi:hypothetical protein